MTECTTTHEIYMDAIRAIADRVMTDFPTALDWGQWTRAVTTAALLGDADRVRSLLAPFVKAEQHG